MGFKTTPTAIYDQLRSLAKGEMSLMPSPEEAMQHVETILGRPLNENELELAKTWMPNNRPEQDARNRESARLLLRLMGQEP
jgi:hypothetical protein